MFSTFEEIKNLATKRGISLQKVAEDLNFSVNYLYTLKEKVPSSERLQIIADYFNVSTDYLLGRTNNPHIADNSNETFSAKARAIARNYDSANPNKRKYYDGILAAMFEDDEEDD